MVHGINGHDPGLWLHMDHGTLILDQAYHYETPSTSSNHNENILLLVEGQFEEPEVCGPSEKPVRSVISKVDIILTVFDLAHSFALAGFSCWPRGKFEQVRILINQLSHLDQKFDEFQCPHSIGCAGLFAFFCISGRWQSPCEHHILVCRHHHCGYVDAMFCMNHNSHDSDYTISFSLDNYFNFNSHISSLSTLPYQGSRMGDEVWDLCQRQ